MTGDLNWIAATERCNRPASLLSYVSTQRRLQQYVNAGDSHGGVQLRWLANGAIRRLGKT